MKISVLIPAYNEENTIVCTVLALFGTGTVNEVIVIDDGSTDNTARLAEQTGARVVVLEKNMGKGAALNSGARYATGDIICLIDGDLGKSAGEIIKLVKPILTGTAQVTIAGFPKSRHKGGFGIVKKMAGWGIKAYTGIFFYEPLSGQRAMTRVAFEKLLPFADGFGVEVYLTVKAIKKGLSVIEVDTNMSHEETGRNLTGFWHRGRQLVHVLKALLLARGLRYD